MSTLAELRGSSMTGSLMTSCCSLLLSIVVSWLIGYNCLNQGNHIITYLPKLNLTRGRSPLLLRRVLGHHGRVVVVRGVTCHLNAVEVVRRNSRVHQQLTRVLHKRRTSSHLVLKSHHGRVCTLILVHKWENRLEVTCRWRRFDTPRRIFLE